MEPSSLTVTQMAVGYCLEGSAETPNGPTNIVSIAPRAQLIADYLQENQLTAHWNVGPERDRP